MLELYVNGLNIYCKLAAARDSARSYFKLSRPLELV